MRLHRIRIIIIALLLLALALIPFWASRYVENVCLLVCVYVTMASVWNLLAGYSGMVSLGQQMFVGVGGYTLAVLSMYYGLPIFLSILVGGCSRIQPASFNCRNIWSILAFRVVMLLAIMRMMTTLLS